MDSTKSLLRLSENSKDSWTIDDAVKGTAIIGGTGSGKTSASGKTIAKQFLKQGWGGLVLCAKTDEANLWASYCKETGREDDLIIFSKGAIHKFGEYTGNEIVFNPVDYELKRQGQGAGETQNLTNIFMNIYRMGNRIASEGDTKEERYWDTALKRCLNRVIELLKLARENLSYKNMVKVISTSANLEKHQLTDVIIAIEQGREINEINKDSNFCLKCLVNAYTSNFSNDDYTDETLNAFDLVEDYFTEVMPNMGSRTKSVVTESFMGLAEPFLSGILYKHFSGQTNIFPEWTYEQKKIIVLDFPIKEYLDAGIIAQSLFKLLFQQSVERRDVSKYPTPVFLWADEAQYFVNPYDQIFLTTARSSRTATVFLSQNISNYFAVMGSGSDAQARVDSLMGNLSTKIFHANSDTVTNQYASNLIGQTVTFMSNQGLSSSLFRFNFQASRGLSSSFLPQIQPKEFTTLKSGGVTHNFEVESIVFVTGKKWANEKNYIRTLFNQTFNN